MVIGIDPGKTGAICADKPKKKAKKTSPTQRSLSALRKEGAIAHIVEKWQAIPGHPAGGVRIDAWGFGDLLVAFPGEPGAVLVQTTSGPNLAARRTKVLGIPEAKVWLECGNRILLEGWRKTKPRGQKVARWSAKREFVTLEDFDGSGKTQT